MHRRCDSRAQREIVDGCSHPKTTGALAPQTETDGNIATASREGNRIEVTLALAGAGDRDQNNTADGRATTRAYNSNARCYHDYSKGSRRKAARLNCAEHCGEPCSGTRQEVTPPNKLPNISRTATRPNTQHVTAMVRSNPCRDCLQSITRLLATTCNARRPPASARRYPAMRACTITPAAATRAGSLPKRATHYNTDCHNAHR